MCLAFELYCPALHYFGPFQRAQADFHRIGVKKHTRVTQYQIVLATGHGKA